MTSELTEIKSNNNRDQLWSTKDTQRHFHIVDDGPKDLLQQNNTNEHRKVLLWEKLPVKIYLKKTPVKVEMYLRVEDQSALMGILEQSKLNNKLEQ